MLNDFFKNLAAIAVVVAIFPLVSFAQLDINTPYSLSNELGVEIIPTYPRPNENVSINLSLYTDDLNSATITWYKDGKNVLSGKGETRYTFKTGAAGDEVAIEISVELLGGTSFSKLLTFNPAGVDILWESDSYVPPFYRGKALHSAQGNLKIVAMPEFVKNGRVIPAGNLIYKWSNDVETHDTQSGYGKNVLLLNGSLLGRGENITITVTDPVNNLTAQGFLNITPASPEIVFYENNPYYGQIFESAITEAFNMESEEVQILAAPFYFTKDSGLKYVWRLNNQTIPGLLNSRTAVFRKPEGESGRSVISLSVESASRVLQQADGNLIMNFSK